MDWTEVPRFRNLTFVTRSCEWADHVWEPFVDDRAITARGAIVVTILCETCGRTVDEAMANLPPVLVPNEYPEGKT